MMPMKKSKRKLVISMNKMLKAFGKMLKAIYNVFDKLFIVPVSRIVFEISKKVKSNTSRFEKILNKPLTLLYLSLGLAILFFYLVDNKVITLVKTEAEILVNVPVNVEYNREAYVVEGVPETVDITLIGRKSDLYLSKQLGEHEVVLDLTDYKASKNPYKVKLMYSQTIDNLKYKLDPQTVSVKISEKVSTLKTVNYDLMNHDKLDAKLSVESVSLDKTEVVVKGSQETINKIATIKALVDLSNKDFVKEGTFKVDNVPLVAYDDNGAIIKNVEIVPDSISATVKLDSYSIKVPLNVLTTGDILTGKAISSISINGNPDYTIEIYGDQQALDDITGVPVTIDVTDQGANGSKTYNVTISKPTGVRYMSETSATIVVNFGDEKQRLIEKVPLSITKGLDSGLSANVKTLADRSVDIQVKGVQSVIDNIKPENITTYVDLSGYTTGEHEVNVYVESNDPRVSYVVTKPIKIIISNAK